MKIEYSKKAAKYINALDKPNKQRLKSGIEGLTKKPPTGDIKPMKGYSDGRLRLRIGKFRIVYNYFADEKNKTKKLYIMDIDSRGDIYK